MSFQEPRWLAWLCPVAAGLSAWLLGHYVFEGGFVTTAMAALVCGFMPLLACKLWKRFARKA